LHILVAFADATRGCKVQIFRRKLHSVQVFFYISHKHIH
jgi:hypothetical protein